MFSLICAHTNDYIPKEKFVAAGAGIQFTFGLGAMGGPFLMFNFYEYSWLLMVSLYFCFFFMP